MAWPSANISLSNVDADSDSISSARADIYQAFTSLNDIIQVGPGSGSGSGGFSGNLFGNTLVDSVNYRILANASPQQNVTQISTYTQGVVVTTTPSYTGANLTMNNQTIGMAIVGNVNFLTSWAAGTRTTNLNTAYLGVTATSANTSMNANDRFRAYGGSIDMNLNGKNWGNLSSTSVTQFPILINGQTMNIYGTGTMGQAAGISNAVSLVPINGSISAQYMTGYNTGLSFSTSGGGYSSSNVQYARLYTGTVSGMTGNLTVNNAIALHTISGWVSANVSLVNNAYVILNEDARSVIQTAGNIVSTGSVIQTSGNIVAGNVTSTNGYFWANGTAYSSGSGAGTYANTNVGAYLAAGISSNIVTTGTGNQYGTMQTFNERVVALGNVSGVTTVNVSLGSVQTMTLTGNVTINTNDIINAVAGSTATLIITQDATGGRTLTSNLRYTNGNCTLSTAANSIDTIRVLYDGARYFARLDKAYVDPTIWYLIVAGGGGGAGSNPSAGYPGAGGGAGGLITGNINLSSGTTYTITVGAGGTTTANGVVAGNGSNSSAFSLTAIGGGGGGSNSPTGAGKVGGSGGGGFGYLNNQWLGGAGTLGQGNAGGAGYSDDVTFTNSGGGGGAGAVGGNANVTYGGVGGSGISSTITGATVSYAGGGGGSTGQNATNVATGGVGGGGSGGAGPSGSGPSPTAGNVNTGGGGGGGIGTAGGTGGSGVVILAIPTAIYTGTKTGSPTVTTSGVYTILKFTASGTYTA